MKKYILAGVGTITAFSQGDPPKKIFTSTTTQDAGLTIGVTAEDIRGSLD